MGQRESYIEWSQSAQVDVLVGSDKHGDGASRKFNMPQDLLVRRSRVFKAMLESCFKESTTGLIKLPETSVTTFEDFFLWAMSPTPHIDLNASMEVVTDLAVFAEMYDVVALQHEAVDIIRDQLGDGTWHLQPAVVQNVYQHVAEHSVLRKLIGVALGSISQSDDINWNLDVYSGTTEGFIHGWREVFAEVADAGADFVEATKRDWGRDELTNGGPCRFHDHRRRPVPGSMEIRKGKCPFRDVECFVDQSALKEMDSASEILWGKTKKAKKDKKKKKSMMFEDLSLETPERLPDGSDEL